MSKGASVGIFGPWGSGKTSFVNLARAVFDSEGVPVLDFNPWLFSGTEELLGRFFAELSAELRLRNLSDLGIALEDYGNAFTGSHWAVGTIAVIPKFLGKYLQHRYKGVSGHREKLEKILKQCDKQVVVLDDVDRLSSFEIRDVFKLVRLTASFPNLIYVVPCDRHRVERALDEPEQGLSGSDYLEKIIQFPYSLPEVPSHILHEEIASAIEEALAGIENPGPFDEQAWPDINLEIVRPLIRNMRDVRRYAIAIRQSVADLEGRVDRVPAGGVRAWRPTRYPAGRAGTLRLPRWAA